MSRFFFFRESKAYNLTSVDPTVLEWLLLFLFCCIWLKGWIWLGFTIPLWTFWSIKG